jgi:hypothetical protein
VAYSNNIPLATDRIKDSQEPIRQNFSGIDTFINVNHVGFDLANEGKHKHVSFPEQSSSPTTAANEVALFSRESTLTSVAELVIRKESDGDVVEFTSAGKATAGWTRLPSGILLKWSSGLITAASGTTTYNWPTGATIPAFTAVYDCQITTRTTGNEDKFVQLVGFSTTQVQTIGTFRTTTTQRAVNYNVFAIGI